MSFTADKGAPIASSGITGSDGSVTMTLTHTNARLAKALVTKFESKKEPP